MKLAMAYTSRNRTELVEKTLPPLLSGCDHAVWFDGSTDPTSVSAHARMADSFSIGSHFTRQYGGPDYVLIKALRYLLTRTQAAYVGILESDVFLESDWRDVVRTYFNDPLVGAVSARTIAPRVLIPLGDHAVMHNLGAGHIIMRREAAWALLNSYRQRTARDVRHVVSSLAGMTPEVWGSPEETESWLTCDWGWDATLMERGWCSVAPVPTVAHDLDAEPGNAPPLVYEPIVVGPNLAVPDLDGFRMNLFDRVWRRNVPDCSTPLRFQDTGLLIHVVPVYRLPHTALFGRWTAKHDRKTMTSVCYRAGHSMPRSTVTMPVAASRVDVCMTGEARVALGPGELIHVGPFEQPTVAYLHGRYGVNQLQIEMTEGSWLHYLGFDHEQPWFHDPFDGSHMPPAEE